MSQEGGNPWKNERFFTTYEEAQSLKNSLTANDKVGLIEVKIKRCGIAGQQYVVKSRQNTKVLEELKQIEEKMTSSKKKNKN